MNTAQRLNPQQQLRNPYCKRSMRFTKEGYEALLEVKRKLEAQLERPISESCVFRGHPATCFGIVRPLISV